MQTTKFLQTVIRFVSAAGIGSLAAAMAAPLPAAAQAAAPVAQAAAPVAHATMPATAAPMTAEQDHQNMMDQLHITFLRPGADGFHAQAPNAQNTDEAKANRDMNLPDPLVLNDGRRVTTAKQWWTLRRPQIAADFDEDVYGRVPRTTPKVTWQVLRTIREANGGVPVVTKVLVGDVDNAADPAITVDIHLSLSTPADASGPVPVMLEFGFPEGFSNPFAAFFAGRGPGGFAPPPGPTWQQQCLARGYGYASIDPASIQADSGAGLTQGVIGLCNRGRPRKPDDWGALRAWAWGADRALDYFAADNSVDAKQVGIEGLSRYGKATLVAMAYDPRFAIAFVGSSGEGGAKLWRRNFGETEGNIASTGEYHWMAGNFLKYDGPLTPRDLPVDSHELIALCAPRPVFISCGSPTVEGTWVDDRGMFLATVAAGPVYRLLGKQDLGTAEMPPIGTALTAGDLAWRQHSGGHTTGPNWPSFLDFAARYLKAPGAHRAAARAGARPDQDAGSALLAAAQGTASTSLESTDLAELP